MNDTVWVQIKIDDDDDDDNNGGDDNNDDEYIYCSVRSTKLISWKNVIKTGMYQYYW